MDIPGEKLVIRLWETLAEKGIGSLLTPWQTLREGRARIEVRRQELLMLAQAERDAADLRAGRKQLSPDGTQALAAPASVLQDACFRIEPVLDFGSVANAGATIAALESARGEINRSKAVLFAEEELVRDPQEPAERKVDEDWLHSWQENAGRVSAEDLQRLWGSVLAGEVKCPGKYSLRTLDFLRTISKEEADLFSTLARYVISGRVMKGPSAYLEARGIDVSLLLRMQNLGLLSGVESIGLSTIFKTSIEGRFRTVFVSHNKALIAEHEEAAKRLELEVYLLTDVGKQVLDLGKFAADIEYLQLVGRSIAQQGFTVRLADWIPVSEVEGRFVNPQPIDHGGATSEA
ncbi:DUF2806 domain-containing protein [Ramlibacter sp. G-1-2-2]|uniref:DUF2806 domain-containing protein n=1 Tax=Ramlibacter agri TaxID=2728837 RepID=A0A848H2G4_9BURK|nr:DUF2806 domain-containing protein [Ramlibacter agri]NML43699.1 DUF2806 domain-containing protein [Ramlibacter agri]